jgi:hypothetical protein
MDIVALIGLIAVMLLFDKILDWFRLQRRE